MGILYHWDPGKPDLLLTVILLKQKLKIDDALDAFGCHGIGGIWGGIATGLFGKTSINSVAKWDGLVFGDHRLFLAQVLSIVITIADLYTASCRSEGRDGWSGCVPAWRECISVI